VKGNNWVKLVSKRRMRRKRRKMIIERRKRIKKYLKRRLSSLRLRHLNILKVEKKQRLCLVNIARYMRRLRNHQRLKESKK